MRQKKELNYPFCLQKMVFPFSHLARLKSLNNLRGNRIYPGMRLELSAKTYVSSNSKYYQVKRGDNLINIAQKFGLSLGKLKRLNGLRSNNIFVGTKLKITPSSIFHYRVKRGDNLTQIAGAFGMSVYQLRKLNGLTSNRIYAGARLKVESGSANIIKYKVRSGDNLTKIAQKFDSSIRSIKRLNNLAGNRIFRGQVLTVKSSTDGV